MDKPNVSTINYHIQQNKKQRIWFNGNIEKINNIILRPCLSGDNGWLFIRGFDNIGWYYDISMVLEMGDIGSFLKHANWQQI